MLLEPHVHRDVEERERERNCRTGAGLLLIVLQISGLLLEGGDSEILLLEAESWIKGILPMIPYYLITVGTWKMVLSPPELN